MKHKELFDSETLYAASEAEASHYCSYRKYKKDVEKHDSFKAYDAGYRKGFRAAQCMLKDRIRYAVFNESNEN